MYRFTATIPALLLANPTPTPLSHAILFAKPSATSLEVQDESEVK